MPGMLAYAAAGGVQGLGAGMVEDGKAKRERMLKMLDQQFQLQRDDLQDQRLSRREESRDTRTAEREDARDARTAEREEARDRRTADREGGMLSGVVQDEGGNFYGYTRSGEKRPLGVKGPQKGMLNEPLVEVDDPESESGTTYVRRRDAVGKPGKGTKEGREARAAAEGDARAAAEAQARREAGNKAGWFSSDATDFKDTGGDREAWIQRRTDEILGEKKGGKSAGMLGQGAGDFNPDGGDYDYATAQAAGMGPDGKGENAGHWGSVAPASDADREKYGLPEGSSVMLKGRKHPTWDKAVEAEEARGSKIVKRGGRYFSVPGQGKGEGQKYGSAADVRAAVKAGKLGRDEALAILRRDFGYE